MTRANTRAERRFDQRISYFDHRIDSCQTIEHQVSAAFDLLRSTLRREGTDSDWTNVLSILRAKAAEINERNRGHHE